MVRLDSVVPSMGDHNISTLTPPQAVASSWFMRALRHGVNLVADARGFLIGFSKRTRRFRAVMRERNIFAVASRGRARRMRGSVIARARPRSLGNPTRDSESIFSPCSPRARSRAGREDSPVSRRPDRERRMSADGMRPVRGTAMPGASRHPCRRNRCSAYGRRRPERGRWVRAARRTGRSGGRRYARNGCTSRRYRYRPVPVRRARSRDGPAPRRQGVAVLFGPWFYSAHVFRRLFRIRRGRRQATTGEEHNRNIFRASSGSPWRCRICSRRSGGAVF